MKRAAPWIAASAAVAAFYLAVALAVNGGRFALPLDDSYIFLQYARQAAHGHLFVYTPGSGSSSGVTSPLYLLVLTLAYLIGLRGPLFPFVPIALGVAGLAVSAAAASRIATRLWGREPGLFAAALLLLHGPLVWHFLSGMETPLLVPLLLLSLEAFLSRRFDRFAWTSSLLALTRPEGWIAALMLAAWAVAQRMTARRAALAAPVLAGIVPLALNLAASGRLQSNSMLVKAPAYWGHFYLPSYFYQCARYFFVAWRDIFANIAPRLPEALSANDATSSSLYFAPGAVLLALAAIAAGPAAAAPILAALGLLVLLVSAILPLHIHWERYLVPAFPLFLLLIAGGVGVLLDRVGRAAARVAAAYVLIFQLAALVTFAFAYASSVHDLAFMHLSIGRRIDAQLPRDARIATNDVGALAYYGKREIVDLDGLTTNEMTRPARNGAASIFEAIEAMPASRRPTHLCVFPSWYDEPFTAMHEPLSVVRLFETTIVGGNPMILYRADWSLAGSGDEPRNPALRAALAGHRLSDRVDVADLDSEKAHAYRFWATEGGYEPRFRVSQTEGDSSAVADGGRLITGGERFRMRVQPGHDAVLMLRTDGLMRAHVRVDGRDAGQVQTSHRTPEPWYEEAVRLPGSAFSNAEARIEITTDDPHYAGYGSYMYWLFQ